jgi:hypothetical protein
LIEPACTRIHQTVQSTNNIIVQQPLPSKVLSSTAKYSNKGVVVVVVVVVVYY